MSSAESDREVTISLNEYRGLIGYRTKLNIIGALLKDKDPNDFIRVIDFMFIIEPVMK